jgi:hypothetical protein
MIFGKDPKSGSAMPMGLPKPSTLLIQFFPTIRFCVLENLHYNSALGTEVLGADI